MIDEQPSASGHDYASDGSAIGLASFKGNVNTRYGLAQEANTILEYELYMKKEGRNYKVEQCDLTISAEHPKVEQCDLTINAEHPKVEQCDLTISAENPYLAVSPDGIVSCGGEKVGLVPPNSEYTSKK